VKLNRILLAGDPGFIGRSLRPQIESESGWQICGETGIGRDAVELAAKFHPEIVVIDATMPDLNAVEAAREIKTARAETELLFLIGDENADIIEEILSTGARGHLLKSDAHENIILAIRSLCEHRQYIASQTARAAFERYLKTSMPRGRSSPGASAVC
jgi:DNA-binding NarL/FixJ family response regulator